MVAKSAFYFKQLRQTDRPTERKERKKKPNEIAFFRQVMNEETNKQIS